MKLAGSGARQSSTVAFKKPPGLFVNAETGTRVPLHPEKEEKPCAV